MISSNYSTLILYTGMFHTIIALLSFSLSVEKTVSFNQQATGAVLDLIGDENEGMKKSKNVLKWYNKRSKPRIFLSNYVM